MNFSVGEQRKIVNNVISPQTYNINEDLIIMQSRIFLMM